MPGSGKLPQVQEKLAELIGYVEVQKACLRAAEADAAIDRWGIMSPALMPIMVARNLFISMYPRMVEIIQLLGSSSLMALPTEADFASPIAPDLDRAGEIRLGGERHQAAGTQELDDLHNTGIHADEQIAGHHDGHQGR